MRNYGLYRYNADFKDQSVQKMPTLKGFPHGTVQTDFIGPVTVIVDVFPQKLSKLFRGKFGAGIGYCAFKPDISDSQPLNAAAFIYEFPGRQTVYVVEDPGT